MHAELNVRFELSIDENKTIPRAALAEFVTEQNIESVLLEALVESLDAARVEALCGEKHAQGNGDHRYQRAGTDTRTAVTTAGENSPSTTSKIPSPTTINRHVREYGSKLKQFLPARVSDTETDAVILTEQSATAKTTTARTTLSRQRWAKILPTTHAPSSISR